MKYSLLVPCYNAEAYIEGFLDNVSKLNKPFDEVLFYDDASIDGTYKKLTDKGCTVIRGNINKGPGYARNRLAENAAGDYIHFHDIDDEFNPDFLNLVGAKLAIKLTDVVLGYADWIDRDTRTILIKWRYNQDEIITYPVGYFLSNPLGIINTVYKKEAFTKVNGFDEQIKCWEDADLHVKLAAAGASFVVIDKVIAYSLRHNSGISNRQDWCWECRMKFLESYLKTLDRKHRDVLGIEFEKTAYSLFAYNKSDKAKKAFHNSRKCGHDAPIIKNGILIRIKNVSPLWAFLLKASVAKIKRNY
jgi:glycosyltransferase involved in cell wall biosynthesis